MEWRKKTRRFIVIFMFFTACLALSFGALAAPPDDRGGGPPEGSGPPEGEGPDGEKGRKPTNPGGTKKGDLMGDLWVVVRDVGAGDGAPVKFNWTWNEFCYDANGDFDPTPAECLPLSVEPVDTDGCAQPISFNVEHLLLNADAQPINEYDAYIDSYGEMRTGYLVPVDPECKVPEKYAEWTLEVESGRLNMARTTTYVLEAAYAEALANINSALSVDLDPAGRLLLTLPDLTDPAGVATYEKVVDSPRENLALYQTLMLGMKGGGEGCLPGLNPDFLADELTHLVCGAADDGYAQDLLRAAAFLGGAADKFGSVGIDEVIYLNNILEINFVDTNPADGSIVVEDYFDFTDAFVYDRQGVFEDVEADLLQPPADPTVYPDLFNVVFGVDIYAKIFSEGWAGTSYPYPVVNFVRAVDDSVGVIFYIHNYELPECIECLEGEQLP